MIDVILFVSPENHVSDPKVGDYLSYFYNNGRLMLSPLPPNAVLWDADILPPTGSAIAYGLNDEATRVFETVLTMPKSIREDMARFFVEYTDSEWGPNSDGELDRVDGVLFALSRYASTLASDKIREVQHMLGSILALKHIIGQDPYTGVTSETVVEKPHFLIERICEGSESCDTILKIVFINSLIENICATIPEYDLEQVIVHVDTVWVNGTPCFEVILNTGKTVLVDSFVRLEEYLNSTPVDAEHDSSLIDELESNATGWDKTTVLIEGLTQYAKNL